MVVEGDDQERVDTRKEDLVEKGERSASFSMDP